MTKINAITKIGFRKVGKWIKDSSGIKYVLDDFQKECNILYAFVSRRIILYVGVTEQTLKSRMYGYQNPNSTQRTNVRNNRYIKDLLVKGERVDIYAWSDDNSHYVDKFHVNMAAGLEKSIIKMTKPLWNGKSLS